MDHGEVFCGFSAKLSLEQKKNIVHWDLQSFIPRFLVHPIGSSWLHLRSLVTLATNGKHGINYAEQIYAHLILIFSTNSK
jgi:hypothetical protein